MSITVTVENDTIKLPVGVHVPDGTKIEITIPLDKSTAAPQMALSSPLKGFAGGTQGFPVSRGRAAFTSADVARIEAEE